MTQAVVTAQNGGADYSGTFRNKIINGDMRINQRGASSYTSPANPTYTVDRWYSETNLASQYTVAQNANSVTPPAGFSNYLGVINGSAYTITTSDYAFITQRIEGYNWSDLGWGASGAKTVTLSFWVYSSVAGTYSFSFENPTANNQSYNTTYTISSVNTWTQISIAIPGPTSGTWNTTNGAAVVCRFSIGTANTSLIGAANAWSTGRPIATTGAQSIFGVSNSVWYLTGVQIEVGTQATPFERRPFGMELGLCQRYYQTSFPYGTAPYSPSSATAGNVGLYTWKVTMLSSGYGTFSQIPLISPMRAAPTITGYNGGNNNNLARNVPAATDITNISTSVVTNTGFIMQCYGGAGDGTGTPLGWNWAASAEL